MGMSSDLQDRLPVFDFRRWGVGGVVMVMVLVILGIASFAYGFFDGSVGLEVLGTVCLVGGILVFVIKSAEEVRLVTAKWSIVGEVGEVVKDTDRENKGLVRVRSELWSARSDALVGEGTKVRVTRVEGLTAWVARLEDGQTPAKTSAAVSEGVH